MRKTIRMTLSVLLTILLILGALHVTAFAVDINGTCGSDIYWDYSGGTLLITSNTSGGGAMENYSASFDPSWVDYTDDIEMVKVSGVKNRKLCLLRYGGSDKRRISGRFG